MGFLPNGTVLLDAILTKKGRELLARGQNEFNITKFALSDDEVDYTRWDVTHPNGTDYYGAVIENMPLTEAIPDENQVMRYKLVTLPQATAKLPILEVPTTALNFANGGLADTITPNTRNGSDNTLGYTFILHDADAASMELASAAAATQASAATIPFFLNDAERANSITVVGRSITIISRTLSTALSTQLTIIGNETGATVALAVTVQASS